MEVKNYWYSLSKRVYVSFNSHDTLLLYNTENGNKVTTNNSAFIDIVKAIYLPENLGVIDIHQFILSNETSNLIEESLIKGIGIKVYKTAMINKPINFLPILNLQYDIDKLILNNEKDLVGESISTYLTTIDIYLNSTCTLNCIFCTNYYKQFTFCTKNNSNLYIEPNTLYELFKQASSTQTKKINILGGNIMLYPNMNELFDILHEFEFEYHIWINIKNLSQDFLNLFSAYHIELLIEDNITNESILKIEQIASINLNFSITFAIENNTDLKMADTIVTEFNLKDYRFKPFFNGNNYKFIKENVFLNEDDILSEIIGLRRIFCNQKLNSSFFGNLQIHPDKTIRANPNKAILGTFPESSLLELIYSELTINTTWRITRDGFPCNGCIYRYLCPPPGNLEFILNKNNLCRYK